MKRSLLVACALAAPLGALHAAPVSACGVAYPAGGYARLASERTVIVWDAASKTEHFIRKPTFDGDAKEFGFFIPTPSKPDIAKVDDAILDRVAALVPEPKGDARAKPTSSAAAVGASVVDVLQRLEIDGYDLATLRASSGDDLGEWLRANGFVDRPALRVWADAYLKKEKGWVITAMKYAPPRDVFAGRDGIVRAPPPPSRRAVGTPTLRFSFAIETPFYPYYEPQPEKEDALFIDKYTSSGHGPPSIRLPPRPVEVWLVSASPLYPMGNFPNQGLPILATASIDGARVAEALGDTSRWRLDPRARKEWVVTHMREALETRNSFEDLTFEAQEPRANPALVVPAAAPAAQPSKKRRHRLLAFGGLIALVLVIGLGAMLFANSERPGSA